MTRSLLAVLVLAVPIRAEPKVDQHGDPLPDGAIVRFGTIRDRIGSTRVLRSFALSPDGKTLAAETPEGITLWDVDTGRPARRLPWRTWQGASPKFALCFSPEGQFLARMAGRVVAVWDLTTGNEVFDIDYKEEGELRGIGYLPGTDQIIATSDRHPRAWVLNAKTGKILRTVEFGGKYAELVPAGRFVLGRAEETWALLDPGIGKERVRFPATNLGGERVTIAPDGKRAWVATFTGQLRSVDTETGHTLEELTLSPKWGDGGIDLAISPDGSALYVGEPYRAIYRRDLKAGKWLPPITGVPAGNLIPHPDGKRLLLLGGDGVLRRYDLTTLKRLPGTDGFEEGMFATPAPDGRRVLIGSGGRLHLFDIAGWLRWSVGPGDWGTPQWCPGGRNLVSVGVRDVTLHDAATGRTVRTLRPPADDDQFVYFRAYFPPGRGRLIVPVGAGQALAEFDLATGERTALVRTGAPWKEDWFPFLGDLSPDGRRAVFSTWDGGLRLFDLSAGRLTARGSGLQTDRKELSLGPRFSPDGSYLLTWVREQARAPTWAPRTLAILHDPVSLARKLEFEADEPEVIAFSSDGLWLALGRGNGDWSLWDIPTGERVGVWEGHRDSITSIGFAGPGRVLTGSADLTALLWDLRPKEKPKKPVWEALSGDDGREAYRATWALAADPNAHELLRAKVSIPPPVPADKVKQYLADLSADRFAVREAATKALQDLGRLAEPDLRSARDAATTEEVRSRLDGLLAKIPRERTKAEIVQARAVQALELAGTDAAKKLLAEWAAGPAGARLTIDAKAALGRLAAAR